MVTINPAVLNTHALNIVTKVGPTNFGQRDRVEFFTWLDTMIRTGTSADKREEVLFQTLDQIFAPNIRNTVVQRNRIAVPNNYWGRITNGQDREVGRIIDRMLEDKHTNETLAHVEGRASQVIDLFSSIVTLVTSDHPREEVAEMVREYLEPDIVSSLPTLPHVRPARVVI